MHAHQPHLTSAGNPNGLLVPVPVPDEVAGLVAMFKLLGDPTRVRLLYALVDAEEMCVQDAAATVGVSESTTSHAFRLLRASRVVTARRSGRQVFYRLSDAHVRVLLDVSRAHIADEQGGS